MWVVFIFAFKKLNSREKADDLAKCNPNKNCNITKKLGAFPVIVDFQLINVKPLDIKADDFNNSTIVV